MEFDAIIDAACERTGLSHFGSSSFEEGLAIIVGELSRMDTLRPGARERLEQTAIGFLANRLRVAEALRRQPHVLNATIERPLFVFGMPRTGTTLLSNLLWQDPARRTLLNWEAMDSTPPATRGALTHDPRAMARQDALNTAAIAFPNLGRIHHETAIGPTECLSIHKQEFRALWWDAQAQMPCYSEWILHCNMEPAYQLEKQVLQLLQSTNPGAWQLKMPSHALHIEALLKVFPEARLVWTHRDPFKALGSLLSLVDNVSSTNVEPDLAFMRHNYPRQAREHLLRPMAVRDRLGEERIHDVHYADLVRDPIGAVRRLYGALGDALTHEAEQAMQQWLGVHPQGRLGRHEYSLGRYGLTVEGTRRFFAEYLDHYEIEPEG